MIRRFKQGRSKVCEIQQKSQYKNTINGIGKSIFKTNKLNELCDYIMYRNENEDLPMSKQYLSDLCNISKKTIIKWDNKMIENGFMSNDGYFYVVKSFNYDKSIKGYSLTNKEEYKSYIKSTYKIREAKGKLKKKLLENKISDDEFDLLNDSLTDSLYKANDNKIVYRINKYNIIKNNVLYKEIIKLIKETLIDSNKVNRQKSLDIKDDWRIKEYNTIKEANDSINSKLKEMGINVKTN